MSVRVDAYDGIRRDALVRIERRRLRPEGDLEEVQAEVHRAVDEYQRRAHLGDEIPLSDPGEMVGRVLQSITDFGPLTELIARPDVEEIFFEGPRVSYLDSSGRLRGLAVPTGEAENRQIVERLLAPTDRQLNTKHPIVQARVLQGSARLTAAIPPISDRLSATLRRYTVRNVTLGSLVALDSISPEAADFLWAMMQVRSRIAISGEPGAGKTTMAAALIAAEPASHCVRCCEEIREIAVPVTHGSYYEVRPSALDGTGEISLRDLVKFVLAFSILGILVGWCNHPRRSTRSPLPYTSGSVRTGRAPGSALNANAASARRYVSGTDGTWARCSSTTTSRRTAASSGRVTSGCWKPSRTAGTALSSRGIRTGCTAHPPSSSGLSA